MRTCEALAHRRPPVPSFRKAAVFCLIGTAKAAWLCRRGLIVTGRYQGMSVLVVLAVVYATFWHCKDADGAELSVRPSVAVREEYDDNIYLTQNNTVNDYVTRVTPSVSISYKTPVWDLMLSETFYWWYYAKIRRGYYSNDANLASKFTISENLLYFDVTDRYSSVVLNPRGPSTLLNLNVNRTDSNTLTASPYIKYQLASTTTLTTGYAYTNIWYRSGGGINRQQHMGFLNIEQGFSPRLKAVVGFEFMADQPESPAPNDDQTSPFVSVFYTVNPRMKVDATAGYRWINFESGPDHNSPVYNVGAVYQFSDIGKLELRASQLYSFSPTEGIVKNMIQKLTASYGESLTINGSVYHIRDDYFQIGQTNDGEGLIVGLTYKPQPRLTYRVSGNYERDNYLPQEDKRKLYIASAAVDYKLTPKATLSLTYDYNRSTGQIVSDNYIDNIIGIQLRAEF